MQATKAGPRRHTSTAALLAALSLMAAAPLAAQGWIEPLQAGGPGHVTRLRTVVSADVRGHIAEISVEEWFRNDGAGVAEGAYLYPLPGEAVFAGYSLFQGDQELRGETMDADRARAIYEEIVRRRRDPALIELAGHGMIRARVFPIEPGQTRKITLRYTQVLGRAGDALQLRYAAGVRQAGRSFPTPRPMEPRIQRPLEPPVRRPAPQNRRLPQAQDARDDGGLTFVVRVEDGRRFRDPFSPTHEVEVERRDGHITVRPAGELHGDFELFLPLAEGLVGMTVVTHRPSDDAGYFMLTLSPGTVDAPATPRDVTAVVDVSGSMSGEKIAQTKEALRQLLGSLSRQDRFRLVAFSDRVRTFRSGWSRIGDVHDARAWVDALQADGGTDIASALDEAFRTAPADGRLPIVLFLTDGLPTVGERDPERIAARAEEGRGEARVFAFGVGYDVNTLLLDRLGEAGRGATEYVEPGQDVERAIGLLTNRIRHPILTDLVIDDAPVELVELYPGELPDLFAGEELVVFGRYTGSAGRGELRIRGRRAGHAERYGAIIAFPAHEDGNAFIPRLWASRKIGALTREVRLHGADPELVRSIRETALRYGILTEYTAHLVQEPVERFAQGGIALDQIVVTASAAPASGRGAVEAAKTAQRARAVRSQADMAAAEAELAMELAPAPAGRSVERRVVAGRVFMRTDSTSWRQIDALDATRTVAIKPFSDAYFDLLRVAPELREVFRAFQEVLVAGVDANIALANDGAERLSGGDVEALVRAFRGN